MKTQSLQNHHLESVYGVRASNISSQWIHKEYNIDQDLLVSSILICEYLQGNQVPRLFLAGLEKLCSAWKPGITFQSLEFFKISLTYLVLYLYLPF